MTDQFPRSMSELGGWAHANRVPVGEARQRFAQYGALCSITSVPALRMGLVFKGGNALDFVWQPNRSTIDLDFSLDMVGASFDASAQRIGELLGQGLRVASNRIGIRYAVHSVRPPSPGAGKTFVTYTANVGYALPDERQLVLRMEQRQPSPHVIPVEISLNEPICDSTLVTIDPDYAQLRVSTLEDIVGEKLRASAAADSWPQSAAGSARHRSYPSREHRAGPSQGGHLPPRQGRRSFSPRFQGGVSPSGDRRASARRLRGARGDDANGIHPVRRGLGHVACPGRRAGHPRRVRWSAHIRHDRRSGAIGVRPDRIVPARPASSGGDMVDADDPPEPCLARVVDPGRGHAWGHDGGPTVAYG